MLFTKILGVTFNGPDKRCVKGLATALGSITATLFMINPDSKVGNSAGQEELALTARDESTCWPSLAS